MNDALTLRDGVGFVEGVPLTRIAERCGTPTYVYSRSHFAAQFGALDAALAPLAHRVCYAVKANGNLSVLRLFAQLGAGFDVVSGGELERVVRAGGDPRTVVFSGVGKAPSEIDFALKLDIASFNVESSAELERLEEHARRFGCRARVSVRVNPDIDAGTHPYISTGLKSNKFGVPRAEAIAMYRRASNSRWLDIAGIDCHIGSQIETAAPLIESAERLLDIVDELGRDGIRIEHVDVGGGLGVPYRDEPAFDLDGYASALKRLFRGREQLLLIEPGRYLVANGGVLLTRVEYLKPAIAADARNFAIVDAAMNDLIRPALYRAWHRATVVDTAHIGRIARWDLVGPVCETADFLAHDRELSLAEGTLLAISGAGAYGFALSSNYNARNRPAEVLVDGDAFAVVRRRETIGDQLRGELADDATLAPLQYQT